MMKKVYGTIKGRHPLPVEEYIFEDAIENPRDLDSITEVIADKLDPGESVTLYVTGLTVVTTAVIRFCLKNLIPLTLMHYDAVAQEYYPQVILSESEVFSLYYDHALYNI